MDTVTKIKIQRIKFKQEARRRATENIQSRIKKLREKLVRLSIYGPEYPDEKKDIIRSLEFANEQLIKALKSKLEFSKEVPHS